MKQLMTVMLLVAFMAMANAETILKACIAVKDREDYELFMSIVLAQDKEAMQKFLTARKGVLLVEGSHIIPVKTDGAWTQIRLEHGTDLWWIRADMIDPKSIESQ